MSKTIKSEKLQSLIKIVLQAAHRRREDAAYGGRHDDGGARILETQVKFFNYGWNAAFSTLSPDATPEEWKEFEIKLDPEYEQYQKLKKKFGDR